jgi:hypothetical protein
VRSHVEVFGGMAVLGGIAAADVSTAQTEAQVDPGVASFDTFLADVLAGFGDLDLVEVSALFGHGVLLSAIFLYRDFIQ